MLVLCTNLCRGFPDSLSIYRRLGRNANHDNQQLPKPATLAVRELSASELRDENIIHNLPVGVRRFQELPSLLTGGDAGEGSDSKEPFSGGIRGGDRSSQAFTISLEAIREIQGVEAGYSSEYGRRASRGQARV